ncbi:uncharacterized protein C8A04DRAFT_14886 [Dichotomopilus funicola]|uniref:Adenosine deaminase domain-containing protein n=1 Tax=Dichotomopilus funicola TaxID=1934379 RepID=A0AAN6UX16_9PEZI|nr:hypothetical protein C8A04DRAFT_14886 [Dichotomopilus funicola]
MPAPSARDPVLDYKALPKIELHAHLSGSISRQCLHELWVSKKATGETDLRDPLVEMPPDKHDYDLKTFFPLFSSYIYNLVNDVAAVRYTTLAVLRDFAADGVVYLELRTTPRAMPAAGLTEEGYVQTVLDTIAEFENEQGEDLGKPEGQRRVGLKTKLILSIDRRHTPTQASRIIALARHFHLLPEAGVVGLDLCGDPSVPVNLAALTPLFTEVHSSLPSLALTVHFAEAQVSSSDAELDALLLDWKPDRLGHVICVSERVKGEIVQASRGKKGDERGVVDTVGLELCLSCNVHAGMVCGGFEGHHFGEWWKVQDTVVVLSTDDVGVFESPLSNEYALVAKHFGLNRAEICTLVRRGIDVIFGGDKEKERLREILWTA